MVGDVEGCFGSYRSEPLKEEVMVSPKGVSSNATNNARYHAYKHVISCKLSLSLTLLSVVSGFNGIYSQRELL